MALVSTANVVPVSVKPAPAEYDALSSTSQVTEPSAAIARIDCPSGQVPVTRD
jgi:hypothetical protein